MAANNHYLRKLASDELSDTLFFATGSRVTKSRTPDTVTLTAGQFTVVIKHTRLITVNGDKCKSIPEAKYVVQDLIR
jgi:hypothetical protein